MTKPNHPNWLATNTGKIIDLLDPNIDEITIGDISNNLAKMCRFNGQLKEWYSVAEHCVHVAEMLPDKFKLQGLLHDAAEAYICDVPTPLKRMLGEQYAQIEERIAKVIGQKFGVDLVNLPGIVKQADRAMVVSERNAFQSQPQTWGDEYETTLLYPNLFRYYATPETAARAYMTAFNRYKSLAR
jgi:hypothetical protein